MSSERAMGLAWVELSGAWRWRRSEWMESAFTKPPPRTIHECYVIRMSTALREHIEMCTRTLADIQLSRLTDRVSAVAYSLG